MDRKVMNCDEKLSHNNSKYSIGVQCVYLSNSMCVNMRWMCEIYIWIFFRRGLGVFLTPVQNLSGTFL